MNRERTASLDGYECNATDDGGNEEKELDRSYRIREPITPKELDAASRYIKIMSWNVSSLKSLATTNKSKLRELIRNQTPDILLLQETKVQHDAVDAYKQLLDGYESFWNCSMVKKGYAGTAVFLKKSTIGVPAGLAHRGAARAGVSAGEPSLKKRKISAPEQQELEETDDESAYLHPSVASSSSTPTLASVQKVSYDFEDEKRGHHGEGRTITVEFDSFVLVACYVPNTGQKLERLVYRVREWEPHMRSYLKILSQRKPVVLAGDLNCAHGDLDVHNPRAKHISKMHGATPAERAAFTKLLEETDFRDALRFFHPDAKGQFTYWSQRVPANRPHNKGMRVDYFLCSADMFHLPQRKGDREEGGASAAAQCLSGNRRPPHPEVFDTYILPDAVAYSDHCPIMLVLKLEV